MTSEDRPAPDPNAELKSLGGKVRRTATALSKLAYETRNTPVLYELIDNIVEAVKSDITQSYDAGVEHGGQLKEKLGFQLANNEFVIHDWACCNKYARVKKAIGGDFFLGECMIRIPRTLQP